MWIRFLTVVGLALGLVMFLCNLPDPPPGPEKSSIALGFEHPDGTIEKTDTYIDSLGRTTNICMFLSLTQYFDSVVLLITKEPDYATTYSFNTFKEEEYTAKHSILLPAPGNYTVTLTGYIQGTPKTVSGAITIVGQLQGNQKPVLVVPNQVRIGVDQELVFSAYATDPDANQQVTIEALKKPESATFLAGRFKWTPAIKDTGTVTVTIMASDNGLPMESDTETVTIIVSSTPVNLAPRWISNRVQENATAGIAYTYNLNDKCSDPENDKLTFSLIEESPAGDTVAGTEYIFTPSVSQIGEHTIHIVARDPSGLEDILTLELTVTNNSAADTKPPVFTRKTPEEDTTKIFSSTLQISVLCTDDQSGVDSVKCYSGTTPFEVTKTGDSLYSAVVSNLLPGLNTIKFFAKDKSPAKNLCSLLVYLNYDNTKPDSVPPVITFKSPSEDTVISVDSFEVKVSCIDDSGCSVTGYLDGAAFTLKKSTSVANLWTGMAKGIASGSYSTIKIVAIDSSAAKNKDSLSIGIKYDSDNAGPVVTIMKPASKTTTTNRSSYSIELKCTDTSGVLSVKGVYGTNSVSGVRSGNNWIVTIDNMALGDNKIVLTATDSSLQANRTYDTIFITYDPSSEDKDGPIIKQIGDPASGTIVNSAVVEITDSISDPSGIDSVYWTHNGIKKMMTLVTGKTGIYSLKDTLREGTLDSLVITATDRSTRKNRNQQVITLTYVLAPTITKQPVSLSVCALSQAIFSVNATGTGPLSYQWRKGTAAPFENIGTNSPACTLIATSAAILSCVVSNQAATNATSNLCTLRVNLNATLPVGKATPDTVLLGDNKTVTLGVTTGNPGTDGSWVWYASDKTTKVTTNPFIPTATATYYVRSENGVCGNGDWSSAVKVTVNLPPGTPTGKATPSSVCIGDLQAVALSIVSGDPGTNGSWVWYTRDKVTKVLNNPYYPNVEGISTFYVRSEGSVSGTGPWSSGIQVTANQPAGTPTGTATPSSVCLGDGQQVTLNASGTAGSGGSWVWYTSNKTTKVTSPFTPSTAGSFTYYVRSENGTCGNGPWSSAVTVTVNQPAGAPTGTATPSSVCLGDGTPVTLSATGTPGTDGSWVWYASNKTTKVTSPFTPSTAGSFTYFVRSENGSCGNGPWSSAVTVTVNQPAGAPTGTATPSSVCLGDGTPVTLSATGTPGTDGSWVWYASNKTTKVSSSFTPSTAGLFTYYVRSENGACGPGPWSSGVQLAVNAPSTKPTSISASPSSVVCPNSGAVTLSVVGGSLGTGATWKWYTDQYCTNYYGSGSQIQVTALQTYYVLADGTCNKTGTAQITLTLAPLTITPSPAYGNTCIRDVISITPSCQAKSVSWYYNPFGIPGDDRLITADNSSFTILGNTIRCNTVAGSDIFCIVKDYADREVKSGTWIWFSSYCDGAY